MNSTVACAKTCCSSLNCSGVTIEYSVVDGKKATTDVKGLLRVLLQNR